jgi:hypothetical protein
MTHPTQFFLSGPKTHNQYYSSPILTFTRRSSLPSTARLDSFDNLRRLHLYGTNFSELRFTHSPKFKLLCLRLLSIRIGDIPAQGFDSLKTLLFPSLCMIRHLQIDPHCFLVGHEPNLKLFIDFMRLVADDLSPLYDWYRYAKVL